MISAVCQGLLPTIRHLENRRGEGPGDEVGEDQMSTEVCGQKFVDGSLWTEVCGRKFVDGSLWTEVKVCSPPLPASAQ